MAQELDSQLKALKYKTRVWLSLKMVKNELGALLEHHTAIISQVRDTIWLTINNRSWMGSASSDGRAEKCLWDTRVRLYFSGCDAT